MSVNIVREYRFELFPFPNVCSEVVKLKDHNDRNNYELYREARKIQHNRLKNNYLNSAIIGSFTTQEPLSLYTVPV